MPIAWIALNSVKGLGPVRIGELLNIFGSPEEIFKAGDHTLKNSGLVPDSCIARLREEKLFSFAQEQLQRAHKENVTVLTLHDSRYPVYLKEIFAPPPVIFVKGDFSVLQRDSIAVVGTRVPTEYGKTVARSLGSDIARKGLVIVSGMAKGIDSIAHKASMAARGKTIAVLGCGIDIIYPSSNTALSEQIVENGALISEFPMGTAPEAYNFPRRNRIISGLSAGTVVVEAGIRSGSLITANYALNQNREVFAVPGPITSSSSQGTFNLIKHGAVPVHSARDILENIRFISGKELTGGEHNSASESTPAMRELLSDSEKTVLDALSCNPVRIDQIAEKLNQTAAELFDRLLNMELKGLIRQIGGQQYIRVV